MKDNKLISTREVVSVQGSSTKSKEDALGNAFAMLQKAVSGRVKGIIVYMKPVDVEVEDYRETKKKERYLGILFSREKTTYSVKLRVEVEVSAIDL